MAHSVVTAARRRNGRRTHRPMGRARAAAWPGSGCTPSCSSWTPRSRLEPRRTNVSWRATMPSGPVELLVLRYTGDRFTGVPAAKIKGLVDAGFIRIIDVIFARKGEDGEVRILELNDLDDDEYGHFDPIVSDITGLLNQEDVESLTAEWEPRTTAVVALFENVWAGQFRRAVEEAGGEVVLAERIPRRVIDELEAKRAAGALTDCPNQSCRRAPSGASKGDPASAAPRGVPRAGFVRPRRLRTARLCCTVGSRRPTPSRMTEGACEGLGGRRHLTGTATRSSDPSIGTLIARARTSDRARGTGVERDGPIRVLLADDS